MYETPTTSVENSDPDATAAIHFIQTGSLHMGCLSPGISPTPGKHTHSLLPSLRIVPSTSMMVAFSLMSEGAADIALAIFTSFDSAKAELAIPEAMISAAEVPMALLFLAFE